MKYINDKELIENNIQTTNSLRENIQTDSDIISYLRAAIFSEQPYLAKEISDSKNKEISMLIELCIVFNSILEDTLTDIPKLEFELAFEAKYHSIFSLLTDTIHKYFSSR